jgi:hypothetical protein
MKTNLLIVIIIAILLTSCTPNMLTQEIEVTIDVPTKISLTEVSLTETPVTREPLIKDVPTLTKTPTQVPSRTPLGCLSLLTPLDGAEIPAAGKITFSWEPMPGAAFYVMNIILPSGISFSFETEQTFRDQYIEAFTPGGSYQWNVTAIGSDRKQTKICSSELATFSKPASAVPPQNNDDDGKKRK